MTKTYIHNGTFGLCVCVCGGDNLIYISFILCPLYFRSTNLLLLVSCIFIKKTKKHSSLLISVFPILQELYFCVLHIYSEDCSLSRHLPTSHNLSAIFFSWHTHARTHLFHFKSSPGSSLTFPLYSITHNSIQKHSE